MEIEARRFPSAWHGVIRIVAVFLVTIASILALEGAYRIYSLVRYGMVEYVDLFSVGGAGGDARYGWVLRKNFRSEDIPSKIRNSGAERASHLGRTFTTNRFGYRGKNFSIRKDRQTVRIVAFGGSTTLSTEVDDWDTWPALLESQLVEDSDFLRRYRARKVEVINAAMGGWRSREAALRLQDEVRHFGPDLILLALNWNDFGQAMEGHDPDAPILAGKPWWLNFKIAQNLRTRYFVQREHDKNFVQRRREGLKRDALWVERLKGHILEMQAIAKAIKAEIIIINLPGLCRRKSFQSSEINLIITRTRVTLENCPLWAELKDFETDLFKEIGRQHGIRVIDVHERFDSFSGYQRLEMFVDEMHMTARGTRETAKAIWHALSSSS